MISGLLDTACQQGFLYAIAVFGIVLTLRVLHWPDLTVDGSFTLGASVLAVIIASGGNPWLAMVLAAIAGFMAGAATFVLNRKLGISKILSGILIMLILYSVNLRIMGKANISLLRIETLFTVFDNAGPQNIARIVIFFLIAFIFLIILCYLMITRLGMFIRATGDNEFMVQSQGVNTDWLLLIGVGLSNSLVAISGAFVAQNQGFADISMGTGLIITGIAALIIGESFVGFLSAFLKKLGHKHYTPKIKQSRKIIPWQSFTDFFSALVGTFLYFFIVALCLNLGLAPTDLKLATGILVILGIALRFKGASVETYTRGEL